MAYNTMTATTLRSTVRDIVDLDTTDLPDSLLNLYIRDGYYRILDIEKRWPFLEKTFTFATVANQRAYVISALTADPIHQVISIVDNSAHGLNLENISYDMGEKSYSGTHDTSSDPLFFAVWEGKIHLWPKPNSVRTMTARGYREPIDWVAGGNAVDAPGNLHFPLVYYACSRVYQRLEDADMAAEYKAAFDEGVLLARSNIMKPTSYAHLRLSAGQTRNMPSYNSWLQSLGRTL